jgi:hypothetical protein
LFPKDEEEYWAFAHLIQTAYQGASIEFNAMCAGTELQNVFFRPLSLDEIYAELKANNGILFN